MAPATAKVGTAELMACLTLVAPSGMTTEDRTAWVAVAKATLTGIPGDLLTRGCRKARETCRFASEIVPTIMDEVKATWNARIAREADEARRNMPKIERRPPEAIPHEVTQKILREVRESMRGRA